MPGDIRGRRPAPGAGRGHGAVAMASYGALGGPLGRRGVLGRNRLLSGDRRRHRGR